uniref:Peptidase S1 domain-containing protein n=1 Tax=Chromera velia CCMP2878 TaxID=1169474 RepID=A0A0G4I7W4_9ALVE|eukprot:Cvel_11703.t1-p1 / transcript=Cvel_11703.t1 / gene=Cvel_11703 / organism=Chromera_velia_CCMP2878 / gene_product=hypothetical protein / transcript_product=hypothetical protein / location=Cvel_scaffold742:50156-56345(-) / protein_length=960 / sequence_SO=supercontig / SO=protein_coding / is_pseudo=false
MRGYSLWVILSFWLRASSSSSGPWIDLEGLEDDPHTIEAKVFWHGPDLSDPPVDVPEARSVAALVLQHLVTPFEGEVGEAAERRGNFSSNATQEEAPPAEFLRLEAPSLASRWSAQGKPLCDDVPFRDEPSTAACTAFLVSEDIVATAAHCFLMAPCSAFLFVFDFAQGVREDEGGNSTVVPRENVYNCSQVVAHNFEYLISSVDWALVRLDRPVGGGRAPLRLRSEGEVSDGERVFMISHISGLPLKLSGTPSAEREEYLGMDFQKVSMDGDGSLEGSGGNEMGAETGLQGGYNAPTEIGAPLLVRSDGSAAAPHCSWAVSGSCEWNETAQGLCASALCRASGRGETGVLRAASEDPCNDGFSETQEEEDFFAFFLDEERVAVSNSSTNKRVAQIVAECFFGQRGGNGSASSPSLLPSTSGGIHPQSLFMRSTEPEPNTVIDSSASSFFVSTLDSFGGSSGAPVLNAETRVVEGLHARGSSAGHKMVPHNVSSAEGEGEGESVCYKVRECPDPSREDNGRRSNKECRGAHATQVREFALSLEVILAATEIEKVRRGVSGGTREATVRLVAEGPEFRLPAQIPELQVVEVNFRLPPMSSIFPSPSGSPLPSPRVSSVSLKAEISHAYPKEVFVILEMPGGERVPVGAFARAEGGGEEGRIEWRRQSSKGMDLERAVRICEGREEEAAEGQERGGREEVETEGDAGEGGESGNDGKIWKVFLLDRLAGHAGSLSSIDLEVTLEIPEGVPANTTESEGERDDDGSAIGLPVDMGREESVEAVGLFPPGFFPAPVPERTSGIPALSDDFSSPSVTALPLYFWAKRSDFPSNSSLTGISIVLSLEVFPPSSWSLAFVRGKLVAPSGREIATGAFPPPTRDAMGNLFVTIGKGSSRASPLLSVFAWDHARVEEFAGVWSFHVLDVGDASHRVAVRGAKMELFVRETGRDAEGVQRSLCPALSVRR